MIVIDDVAEMTKEMWAYLDTVVKGKVMDIERLRGVLLTVLEACEDVNSPDQKVRKEITRTVRKALKEEK